MIYNRVISYKDGRVVFYYNFMEVTYRKDSKEPEIKDTLYNKKEANGLLGRGENIRDSIASFSRDELLHTI